MQKADLPPCTSFTWFHFHAETCSCSARRDGQWRDRHQELDMLMLTSPQDLPCSQGKLLAPPYTLRAQHPGCVLVDVS